jgi:muramoyltetrapeptide carboxypeptidase
VTKKLKKAKTAAIHSTMPIYPKKLSPGDEVRVIAPSSSLAVVSEQNLQRAQSVLEELGLKVSYAKNAKEKNLFNSSSIDARIADLHAAFADPQVRLVLTAVGGSTCNQLLPHIDYELVKANPKIICGFSDITALSCALYAKTDLVTYSGMIFSSFAMQRGNEYSVSSFYECLFENREIEVSTSLEWSDDTWYLDQSKRSFLKNEGLWVLNEGSASGTLVGGNLCTLNLLQGTEYMPALERSVLFIEDDHESKACNFDRDLESLIQQPGFSGVRGIVIGRFQKESVVTREMLRQMIKDKPKLAGMPVIANADFGHTSPMITFPVGGEVQISTAGDRAPIVITRH